MADTTALKNRIRAAIKANDNQEITGLVLQQALLDMVDELNGGTETEATIRSNADTALQQNITAEKNRAEEAESTLQRYIRDLRDAGYAFKGVAVAETNPGIPSGNCFYIVRGAGTYVYFKNDDDESIVLGNDGIYVLVYDSVENQCWDYNQIIGIDDEPVAGSDKLVKSSGVSTKITAEKNRAEGAESTLQQNITTEKNRAEGAESTLQQNITTEKNRAEGAESTLQQNITTEKNRAEGAESTLQQNITTEKNRAEGAESTLQQHISTLQQYIENLRRAGYAFKGVAVAETNPGTPSGSCFYIVRGAGTYTYFKNDDSESIVLENDGLYVLMYDSVENQYWDYNQIIGIDDEPVAGSDKLVKSGGVVKYLQDSGYIYTGNADLTTVPPILTNKYRVFYIAKQAGTYTNFNSDITLAKGEIALLVFNNGIWYKSPVDLASISYIKNTLLSYSKTDWIKDLSSARISISGTVITDNVERDIAISKLNNYIKGVESINYSGYLTIAKFGVINGSLLLRLWHYDTLDTVTVSEISQKHDVTVSAQTLKDNNFIIYDSIPYTSSAFKIILDPSVIDFMGGGDYVYNADNQVSFKYSDNGFVPKDVTNKAVINNGFSRIYKYGQQYVKHLWDYNDALLSIEGLKEEYIYNISKFGYIGTGRFGIVIDFAAKNQTNEITAENYIGEITFTAETSDVSLSGIMRLMCKDSYGTNVLYVTVDFDKLDDTIYLQYSKYGNATIVPNYNSYVFASPIKQFDGYYHASFERIEDSAYITCIIPFNKECKTAIIRGTFDTNANVLLADDSGKFKKDWGIKNQDGSKYSGNTEVYNCVIDCTGYKFLVISSKGTNESAISVQIEGYDANKVIDSYNSLKFATDKSTRDIHLFRSANVNGNFVTSCDKTCRTFQLETSDIANGTITDSVTGFVYSSGLLLEVSPDGTKFYYAVSHSTGNNSILWYEKNGAKTILLRGGDSIPQATGYTALNWINANSAEDLSQRIFVKVMSNGFILVGTDVWGENTTDPDTGKPIIGRYYVIFRITYNGWIPKIITSNQKTYRPNLGYFIKSYGYPTKNNSISFGWAKGRNIIAISEYGAQIPQYWYDRGQDVNGLGVSGKVWVSLDYGNTFYKVFDLDEKINGDADDISDNNWKWCTSYAGRQGMHIHCCYIDQVNNKLWITNGDYTWPDSKNSLYYIDLNTLVNWILSSGTAVDVTNFNPLYTDNEALPPFREFRMFTASDYNNAVSVKVNFQFYCMLAINNCLILGNDAARQIFYIIHGDTIIKDSNVASNDMFIDIAYEIDKDSPSLSIVTFPQLIFRKDENSMIISLWADKGVYGSWNGVDWSNLKPGDYLGIKFTSYLVKDTDGKYIICTPSTHSQKKLLNY